MKITKTQDEEIMEDMATDMAMEWAGHCLYQSMMEATKELYKTVAPIPEWNELIEDKRNIYILGYKKLLEKQAKQEKSTFDPFDL